VNLTYFQTLYPLVVILVVIGLAAWIMKRIYQPLRDKTSLLSVQAAINVGPRERILVIEVMDEWLVVGVTSGQINPLMKIPAPSLDENATPPVNKKGMAQSWLEQFRVPTP
jgi:flagellar protein FliO/FliZ